MTDAFVLGGMRTPVRSLNDHLAHQDSHEERMTTTGNQTTTRRLI
jgi:hypothetical protein